MGFLRGYIQFVQETVQEAWARVSLITRRTALILIAVIVGGSGAYYVNFVDPPEVEAVDTARMLLLWDGTGGVPSGWSDVSNDPNFANRFPRGDTPANVLLTGGISSHTPTVTSTTVENILSGSASNAAGFNIAELNHTHTTTPPSVSTANNDPVHTTMRLIRSNAGVPTTIPAGGIAFFEVNPGAGWTQVTSLSNRMVKINATPGTTAGADTHSHTVTWNALSQAINTNQHARNVANANTAVANDHTHATPPATATSTESSLPPHVKPLVYKATSNVAVPADLIGMFDNNPGGGWAVQSGTGGTFNEQFIRPDPTTFVGTSSGATTHTHPTVTSANVAQAPALAPAGNANGTTATAGHTHRIVSTLAANEDNTPPYFNVVIAKKQLPSMMMFWGGTVASIPAGWSRVTDFYQRYPRGEAPGNYGDLGGVTGQHSHTKSAVTLSGPSAQRGSSIFNAAAGAGHTHDTSGLNVTVGSSNLGNPKYKDLVLIKFNAGIPNTIPEGAITIFDDTPGIPPAGWDLMNYEDSFIRVNNVATGSGAAVSHTHSTAWSAGTLTAGVGGAASCTLLCFNSNSASEPHTHTVSAGNATSTPTTVDPPFIRPLFARARADTSTLSTGLTAMFTGDPGSGWSIQSSAGGKFYKRFLFPGTVYAQAPDSSNLCSPGFGCNYHTHTASRTSGPSSGTVGDSGGSGGPAAAGHTHVMTAEMYPNGGDPLFNSNQENFLPPYFNVVIAEKVDFSLEHYRWYEESTNVLGLVSDPWSSLDIAQSTGITTLPLANKPPKLGDRLRLRVQILVNNNPLAMNDILYKLQYKKSSDGLCSSGTWNDVDVAGGSGVWRFASNASITDGRTLGTTVLAGSTVPQVYARSNPTMANPNPVPAGGYMEYDFNIQHNGADGGQQYSFRVVEDGDILLSEYKNCPILVTMPTTNEQMRHGQFFESSANNDGYKRGYSW